MMSLQALTDSLLSFPAQPFRCLPCPFLFPLANHFAFYSPPLAQRLQCSFVPVRKAKKLPGPCHKVTYTLEYGEDAFEIQKDSIKEGQTVLVVDDLIATGGSASAAGKLVKMAGGKTIEYLFVVGCERPFSSPESSL
jgi:adenine phosphoribosyltransferase